MQHKCFNFEASGHHFRPLDGIAGVALRLFCRTCGRVVPADEAFNTAMWAKVDLPPEIMAEVSNPNEPIN